MQFAMESLERSPEWQLLRKAQFATRQDGVLSGRDLKEATEITASDKRWDAREKGTNRTTMDPKAKGDNDISAFEFVSSLYADDGAFIFAFRKDLEVGTNLLVKHFRKFGMQMHFGTGEKSSKTEFTCIPPSTRAGFQGHSIAPVPIFKSVDGVQTEIGNVTVANAFVYLGTTINYDLDDLVGIKKRIGQAQGMFNKLENCVFKSKDFPIALKSRLYSALVLSILLYGSESWLTTGTHLKLLKTFHHRCVRIICGTTLFAFQRTSKLLKKANISSIESLVGSRFLNWLGHVARMPETAVPRKLLTAFVTHEQVRETIRGTRKFQRPKTASSLNGALKRRSYFQRTYKRSALEWLERATKHPEFEDTKFDEDPATDSVLRELLTKGLSCRSVRDFDVPSWYTLAVDRILWNEVCLLVDHEVRGDQRIAKRQKKDSKFQAKTFTLNADAAIWQLF